MWPGLILGPMENIYRIPCQIDNFDSMYDTCSHTSIMSRSMEVIDLIIWFDFLCCEWCFCESIRSILRSGHINDIMTTGKDVEVFAYRVFSVYSSDAKIQNTVLCAWGLWIKLNVAFQIHIGIPQHMRDRWRSL